MKKERVLLLLSAIFMIIYSLFQVVYIKFTNDKDFNEISELKRVDLNNTASMKIKDKFHNIVKVDDEYKYALIFGGDTSELYMLSRTKTMPEMIKAVYTSYAAKMGYNTDKIVWTTHE